MYSHGNKAPEGAYPHSITSSNKNQEQQALIPDPLNSHVEQVTTDTSSTAAPKIEIQSLGIQQLIELQASTLPEKTALVYGERSLSYATLNQRANQLAHYLQTQGVGPETIVGICMERSIDFVVSIVGILKAGGAYLPLDPTYPTERLAFMLHDSQASVLLTHEYLLERLPQSAASVLCLDTASAFLTHYNMQNPVPLVNAENLVYIIYTSGSTGQPKGVEVTHSSLLNLMSWHQHAFNVSANDRATQVASPAFDATGWELWPYLTIGATIYFPDEETRVTPLLLRNWLIAHEVTISFLPTLLAESLLNLEWPSETALRFLLTGADTLHSYPSPELPFVLVNNYGPTECTVVATSGAVPSTSDPGRIPSIGRPIANTQIYLLDEQLREVPAGDVGELYIGGAGLARGYLNRPELTAERFIRDPFSVEPGARLYKTGDLARLLSDGQIAFVGRTDYQVKIRGYRIELDEIVAVLQDHPSILLNAVIAREDTPNDKRLVAYLVLAPDSVVTVQALHEHLLQRLPEYMVPTAFVLLDTLPLTSNGKLDRAALLPPDETNVLRNEVLSAPMTPIEERVSGIVCALLNIHEVGLDDNFFLLGGHSLLGTQIIMRAAEAFDVNLTLRVLFEAPTVRDLSAEIERLILQKLETLSDDEVLRLLETRHN